MISDIEAADIEAAMREFDSSGRQAFLAKYGFKPATAYLVRHQGKFYDPKALVGAAHKLATGESLDYKSFVTDQARHHLRRLQFEVVPFKGLWWVNQRKTFRAESAVGYVRAPEYTSNKRTFSHWSNIERLRPGQLIIHYAAGEILAISTVSGQPGRAINPQRPDRGVEFVCPVDYRILDTPLPKSSLPEAVLTSSPFDKNGQPKQQYLNEIGADYTLPFLEFLDREIPKLFDATLSRPSTYTVPKPTESMLKPNAALEALLEFKNLVLEGVPGTGKTFAIEQIAHSWLRFTGRNLQLIDGQSFATMVLHPSSSYEDFVEGLRPNLRSGVTRYFDEDPELSSGFAVADGFFLDVCRRAVAVPHKDVLVLIDELNRCNIPSVFGDLMLALEPSKRATYTQRPNAVPVPVTATAWSAKNTVRLPYSGRVFFVPDNVYVVATTNTTDRSVAPLDAALRRRFAFQRLEPQLTDIAATAMVPAAVQELFQEGISVLEAVNERVLRPALGPDALIGHSYFYAMADSLSKIADDFRSVVVSHWLHAVLPQLIDSTRSFNAEELLDERSREDWFARHPESSSAECGDALESLAQLDAYLIDSLALVLQVEGTGLARGARVVDA